MTVRIPKTVLTAIAIGFIMLALPSWLPAAGPVQEQRSPSAVTFSSSVPWASAEVSVSGPAGEKQWTIAAGSPLEIDAAALADWAKRAGVEADGEYTYEVVLAPVVDEATRQVLTEARASGDDTSVKQLQEQGVLPSEPLMASGSLRVENGAIVVDSGAPEAQAVATSGQLVAAERATGAAPSTAPDATTQGIQDNKDQVIADDLIVQGSGCFGFDCVNNENFGFDTLRLKENNLRIKFEDTSTSAGFPSTDWQLTANDSASGGMNRFSIDDITDGKTPFTVEGNAPSNSLYVNSSGNVGIGTSTPGSLELHIKDGDTPTVRLEQDSSAGFAAQTWDVAGNETNFFVRDVTGGSQLPFKILPGADNDSLVIAGDNSVGIGTRSPSAALHVSRATGSLANIMRLSNNSGVQFLLERTDAGANDWQISNFNQSFQISVPGHSPAEFVLAANGDLTVGGTLKTAAGGNYPDYVFDPGYPLTPLNELQQYIDQNKHLPDVPTSEDITKAGGVNISELQVLLLRKVEELTLYTLEQQKRIDELAKQSEKLAQENEALRGRLDGTP